MTASVDLEGRAYVKRSLTQDDLVFLKELQHELNNQPTLATADPRFWVIRDYEYREATDGDDIEAVELFEDGEGEIISLGEAVSRAYKDELDLGGEEHLKANYYHYTTGAHTYGMHAWRSPEVAQLIKLLHTVDFDELSKLVSKE